jgi:hypothetical protein
VKLSNAMEAHQAVNDSVMILNVLNNIAYGQPKEVPSEPKLGWFTTKTQRVKFATGCDGLSIVHSKSTAIPQWIPRARKNIQFLYLLLPN